MTYAIIVLLKYAIFAKEIKMKNLKLRAIALLMLISLLVALVVLPSSAATTGQPSKYSSQSNSGTRDVICTTLNGTTAAGYYTGTYTYESLSTMSASKLKTMLETLMVSTHKTTTSYNDCRDYAPRTDCQNNDGSVTVLYTGYKSSSSEYNSGNGWNREHVWPKSLGNPNLGTSGPGADLHHIRPDENKTNSNRGDKKYGNVTGGTTSTGNLSGMVGGTYSSSYFEPNDNVKGDVARICLYMYVRYGSTNCQSITTVFQSVDVLLEWCELDPVDTWEMGRNEVVYAIQGNRNVFIDYPEYAWLLFGESVPTNMQTPSGKASGGSSGGDIGGDIGGGNVGGGDSTCAHANTVIKNAATENCGSTGYTGDTYCNDCSTTVKKGTTIPATGNHSYGEWTASGVGYEIRKCSVCNDQQTRLAGITENCKHTAGIYTANAVDPTCTTDGYSGDDYCNNCHELVVTGMIIQSEGHSYGEAEIISPATEEKSGLQRKTCETCGDELISTIPATKAKSSGTTVVIIACVGGGAITAGAILYFVFLRKRV